MTEEIKTILDNLEIKNEEETKEFFVKLREIFKTNYMCWKQPKPLNPEDFYILWAKIIRIDDIKDNIIKGEFLIVTYEPQIIVVSQININPIDDFCISKEEFEKTLNDVIKQIEEY